MFLIVLVNQKGRAILVFFPFRRWESCQRRNGFCLAPFYYISFLLFNFELDSVGVIGWQPTTREKRTSECTCVVCVYYTRIVFLRLTSKTLKKIKFPNISTRFSNKLPVNFWFLHTYIFVFLYISTFWVNFSAHSTTEKTKKQKNHLSFPHYIFTTALSLYRRASFSV